MSMVQWWKDNAKGKSKPQKNMSHGRPVKHNCILKKNRMINRHHYAVTLFSVYLLTYHWRIQYFLQTIFVSSIWFSQ
jgi:hypothetical protein